MSISRFNQRWSFIAAVIAGLLSASAEAGNINIQLSDLEITFLPVDGGAIFDSPSIDGGTMDPVNADRLTSATFNLNGAAPPASGGNNVLTMGDPEGALFGDLLIDNVGESVPISPPGDFTGMSVGGGGLAFGFELFSAAGSIPVLALELDEVGLLLKEDSVFFGGEAVVTNQDLPFSLEFDTNLPVSVTYTAAGVGIQGNPATLFTTTGTLNISGTQIPEPATAVLVLFGMAGLGATICSPRFA